VSKHDQLHLTWSLFHLFAHSIINPPIHSSIHSFVCSFMHAFIYSFIHSFIHTNYFIHTIIHLFIHSIWHILKYDLKQESKVLKMLISLANCCLQLGILSCFLWFQINLTRCLMATCRASWHASYSVKCFCLFLNVIGPDKVHLPLIYNLKMWPWRLQTGLNLACKTSSHRGWHLSM